MINPPHTTEKMIKGLNIENWKAQNNEICEEFHIAAKIIYKRISLETAEALIHDALEYRKIYEELNKK